MPKRASILLAALAIGLAIAGCNNGGSSMTPTPSPSVSFTPNPKISAATISVTILGTPAPGITVQMSTPRSSSSPRPGTPFVTKITQHNGQAKFNHLKPSQTYCWVALLGAGSTASTCAPWYTWQAGTIPLGT